MKSLASIAGQWAALGPLLDEALAVPAPEREAWLSALDADRAPHREALRGLLRSHADHEAEDFLRSLPRLSRSVSPDAASPAAGDPVGPYRLLELLGQGGMGAVWLAERSDGVMQRQVALKLPRLAWDDSFAERLVREREILATLAHPHIARLYDAGMDGSGRPFLAMEYVQGEPIDRFCAAHGLPLRRRVELLLQVMSALSHAHARLVVHRDLKPANILVTSDEQVSLLDFGIAKLLEGDTTRETRLTELSGRALTLGYASPEQILGRPLGTGTDVYSLAVVAFELFAGAPPHRLKRGSAAELEEAITSLEAPLASEVAIDRAFKQALRGDLDAILGKALKKPPELRYPTMDAFAQDLQRWLAGEPVQARPDALGYRTLKFIGRHRLEVSAAAVASLALVVGASVALWQSARAQTEARTAKAVQGFIESVFLSNTGNQDDPKRARDTTARELLDRGAARIDAELADAPEARLRLYAMMAELYSGMSLPEKSTSLLRRRVELATQLHGSSDASTILASLMLAKSLLEADRVAEARAVALRADAAAVQGGHVDPELRMFVDAALAATHRATEPLRALAWARHGAAIARQQPPSEESVLTLRVLGEVAERTGHHAESIAAMQAARAQIALQPQAGARLLPNILAVLADGQDAAGDSMAAEATLQAATELARRGGDPSDAPVVACSVADHQLLLGSAADALATLSSSYAWARTAGHDFGNVPFAVALRYARALTAAGDPRQAIAVADEWRAHLAQAQARERASLLGERAAALLALDRVDEARSAMQEAMHWVDQMGATPRLARIQRLVWGATGQPQRALADLRAESERLPERPQGLALLRRQAEEAHWLLAAGHPAEARFLASETLAAIERSPQRNYARLPQREASDTLRQALLAQGRADEAALPPAKPVALRRIAP